MNSSPPKPQQHLILPSEFIFQMTEILVLMTLKMRQRVAIQSLLGIKCKSYSFVFGTL